MRLLLVRHGQTTSNLVRSLDTALPGPGLTELGRSQAAALPAALAAEHIDGVWASEAARAQQTAVPLARALGLPMRVLPGMYEIQAGELEMRNDEESILAYISAMAAWSAGDLEARVPGGESGRSVLERLDAGLRAVAETGQRTAAVVSHGAAIRVWCGARVPNLGPGFVVQHSLDNTGVVVLEGGPDLGWTARSWMDSVLEDASLGGGA